MPKKENMKKDSSYESPIPRSPQTSQAPHAAPAPRVAIPRIMPIAPSLLDQMSNKINQNDKYLEEEDAFEKMKDVLNRNGIKCYVHKYSKSETEAFKKIEDELLSEIKQKKKDIDKYIEEELHSRMIAEKSSKTPKSEEKEIADEPIKKSPNYHRKKVRSDRQKGCGCFRGCQFM